MKKLIVLVSALWLLAPLWACGPGGGNSGGATPPKEKKITNVSVEAVAARDMVEKVTLPGTVFPDQEVLITAEAGGIAERIHAAKGARVAKGELLAEINRQNTKAYLDRAEAALRQVKVATAEAGLGVKRAEKQMEVAAIQVTQAHLALKQAEKLLEKSGIALVNQRNQFERVKKLFEEKLASQSAYDDAQAALKAMEADHSAANTGVDSARQAIQMAESNLATSRLGRESSLLRITTGEADIAAAEAALAQARLQYDKGLITASFDAYVDDIFFDEGEYVKMESPMVKLIRIDPARVKIWVAEKDIHYIRTGQPAEVTVSSLPGTAFRGRVDFVALSADNSTNTYPVEVAVPNPGGNLKAGMVAQVSLVRRSIEGAVSVPSFSVISKEDGDVVFVLENGKAARRRVTTGILENGWTQIDSGLAAGEKLIVKGQRDLQDGQEVMVQP